MTHPKTTNPKKKTSKKESQTSETKNSTLPTPQTPILPTTSEDKSTYLLKLGGKAESPKPLQIGHNLHVSIEGSIVSESRSDNEDGSFTHTYTFKPIRIELLNEKGESIRMKDTRSNGQLLRALIYKRWLNAGSNLEAEDFYNAVMSSAMVNIDKIIESANL